MATRDPVEGTVAPLEAQFASQYYARDQTRDDGRLMPSLDLVFGKRYHRWYEAACDLRDRDSSYAYPWAQLHRYAARNPILKQLIAQHRGEWMASTEGVDADAVWAALVGICREMDAEKPAP